MPVSWARSPPPHGCASGSRNCKTKNKCSAKRCTCFFVPADQPSMCWSIKSPTIRSSWVTARSAPLATLRAARLTCAGFGQRPSRLLPPMLHRRPCPPAGRCLVGILLHPEGPSFFTQQGEGLHALSPAFSTVWKTRMEAGFFRSALVFAPKPRCIRFF